MVWTQLHAHLHQVIRKRNLLQKQQRLLIAVSGGQDSLCLSKLMYDLQHKWNWELGIVHCDHRWREDSSANGEHVEKIAGDWQLPFYTQATTVELANEAAAREWRYQVFTEVASQEGYSCVLTGHTQSDRAETLLYNLLRGSGADGLQALTWQRPLTDTVNLVRPLLDVNRSQTGQFCQEMNLPVWEDTTNADTKYARNRIRHELLPYLQAKFNPNIEEALARTAEILQADVECWQLQAELDVKNIVEVIEQNPFDREFSHPSTKLTLKINRPKLQQLHISRQRRIMRYVLQKYLQISANFDHIEKITALIKATSRSQTDPFPGGAIARVEGDWILLEI